MKIILMLMLLISSSAVLAQESVIYRCDLSDGVPYFTTGAFLSEGVTNCKEVAAPKSNQWNWFGTYGKEGDDEIWKYKYFDEKRPADKLWVKTIYHENKPVKESTTLFSFKCATKQLQAIQYSSVDAYGASSTITQPGKVRYAIPNTTDEELLSIACMKPTK